MQNQLKPTINHQRRHRREHWSKLTATANTAEPCLLWSRISDTKTTSSRLRAAPKSCPSKFTYIQLLATLHSSTAAARLAGARWTQSAPAAEDNVVVSTDRSTHAFYQLPAEAFFPQKKQKETVLLLQGISECRHIWFRQQNQTSPSWLRQTQPILTSAEKLPLLSHRKPFSNGKSSNPNI